MNKQQIIKKQISKIGKISVVTLGSIGFNVEMRRPITFKR